MKILFVCYGGGHSKIVRKVIDELLEENVLISVLALTGAVLDFEDIKNKIQIFQFKHFVFDDESLSYGKMLLSTVHKPIDEKETVAYLGRSFGELVDDHGLKKAKKLFAKRGRQCFLPLQTLQVILDRISPDLVFTTNSPRAEKAALIVAKNMGIKTIACVDLYPKASFSWISKYADSVLVLNEKIKATLVSYGLSEDKIFVTGNPNVEDFLFSYLCQGGVHSQYPCILFASQAIQDSRTGKKGSQGFLKNIDRELGNLAEKHPEWLIAMRLHPGENAREIPIGVQNFSDIKLDSALEKVTVLVTMTSTLGVQAHCKGIPVVELRGSILDESGSLSEIIDVISVYDLSNLEMAIQEAHSLFPIQPSSFPRNSAQNIASLILKR